MHIQKVTLAVAVCLAAAACATRQQATGTAVGAATGAVVAGPVGAVVGAGALGVVASCRVRDQLGPVPQAPFQGFYLLRRSALLWPEHCSGSVEAEQRVVHIARDDDPDAVERGAQRRKVEVSEVGKRPSFRRHLIAVGAQQLSAESLSHPGAAIA